jgi:hypothetical protein
MKLYQTIVKNKNKNSKKRSPSSSYAGRSKGLHHHMQVTPRVLIQNSFGSVSRILLGKNFLLLVVFEKRMVEPFPAQGW